MYRIAAFLFAACLSAFQPISAQVISGDNALLEQLVPESFKFEASAVASKVDVFNWRTNISHTLTNNSGMNLYMGIMMGSVAIGSCSQVNNARGGLQLLPGPNAIAYAVDLSVGTPRPVYVPAGGKITGMLAAEECSAPNPGSPTAPLTLSLMIGKSESRKSMVQISVSAETPIRHARAIERMRDPYEILGVPRGASFEEIRAAYRRACKTSHPDMGGSHEQMVELNTAYARILDELKRGAQAGAERAREEPHRQGGARSDAPPREEESADAGERWRANAADIDEEMENLRRASETLDERLRAMRQEAWREGEKIVWAKLTWDDLVRFFVNLARSGVKGLATLFAALIGIGAILVEANFVSALVILGSGFGLFLSLALKSDKGGFMSAGLLLFGLATIWLPPVRATLFGWPLATISVLVCLGLISKFTHEGGVAGLMTGGVLALFMISVIVDDTHRGGRQTIQNSPNRESSQPPVAALPSQPPVTQSGASQQRMRSGPVVIGRAPLPQPSPTPEVRELRAAQGSILKFVSGVPYQLKVRSGFATTVNALSGAIALYRGNVRASECLSTWTISAPVASAPYRDFDHIVRACGEGAEFRVTTG